MASGMPTCLSIFLRVALLTKLRPSLDTPPFRGGWALNAGRLDQDPGRDVAKEEIVPK